MKRDWLGVLAVVAILGVGFVAYGWLFGNDAADRFRIVSVAGEVMHVRARGGESSAAAGERLATGDRIVSRGEGSAVLGLGDDARITVGPQSSVEVLGVSDEGVQLELEGGKVEATVRPGSGRVGVVADGRELSATDADFTAVRDEGGTLAVSTERGEVAITGLDGLSSLGQGEELVAPRDGSPLRAPASEALLLTLRDGTPPRTREREAKIEGSTSPGARVTVTGGERPVSTRAGSDGSFRVTVSLAEGENRLAVRAESLLGKSTELSATLVRDTRAPNVGVSLEF
ncbi:MAG: FecR domain-containing protein [Deltaproteobacteria bacterium]|nr:FecR domain-containing protein [Deltaproteobacteria bacterium]